VGIGFNQDEMTNILNDFLVCLRVPEDSGSK